jgi:hypothetical protein
MSKEDKDKEMARRREERKAVSEQAGLFLVHQDPLSLGDIHLTARGITEAGLRLGGRPVIMRDTLTTA